MLVISKVIFSSDYTSAEQTPESSLYVPQKMYKNKSIVELSLQLLKTFRNIFDRIIARLPTY